MQKTDDMDVSAPPGGAVDKEDSKSRSSVVENYVASQHAAAQQLAQTRMLTSELAAEQQLAAKAENGVKQVGHPCWHRNRSISVFEVLPQCFSLACDDVGA